MSGCGPWRARGAAARPAEPRDGIVDVLGAASSLDRASLIGARRWQTLGQRGPSVLFGELLLHGDERVLQARLSGRCDLSLAGELIQAVGHLLQLATDLLVLALLDLFPDVVDVVPRSSAGFASSSPEAAAACNRCDSVVRSWLVLGGGGGGFLRVWSPAGRWSAAAEVGADGCSQSGGSRTSTRRRRRLSGRRPQPVKAMIVTAKSTTAAAAAAASTAGRRQPGPCASARPTVRAVGAPSAVGST